MAVFLITTDQLGLENASKLISETYTKDDVHQLGSCSWLVYEETKSTCLAIFTKIFGEKPDSNYRSFVTSVDVYYGLQGSDTWDWLGSKEL